MKFFLPLKSSDNRQSVSALQRELDGHVKDDKLVFEAKDQRDAERKVKGAVRRAVSKPWHWFLPG